MGQEPSSDGDHVDGTMSHYVSHGQDELVLLDSQEPFEGGGTNTYSSWYETPTPIMLSV